MSNKHYLLNKYRYVMQQQKKMSPGSMEELLETEYRNRLASSSTVVIDFYIHPFSQMKEIRLTSQHYPLFYVVLPEHISMNIMILNLSRQIDSLYRGLPPVALDKIRTSQLITEIKSSNDIEGVQSTRKELEEALSALRSKKNIRFKSTVRQYFATLTHEKFVLKKAEEIRALYDELLLDEIEKDNRPDGKNFRKGPVRVMDISMGRAVHSGDASEEEIEDNIQKLLHYMNEKTESDIMKAIVSHYIFEYIHPFYDGNGRLGRFLLSSYLAHKLDTFSALSLSEAILNGKLKYESAFIEVSSPANKGELTFFISEMMKLIIKGQKRMIELLIDATAKMSRANEYIEQNGFSKIKREIIFIMLQHFFFASADEPLTNKEIQNQVEYSRRKVDQALSELEEDAFVKKISRNPIAYRLLTEKLPNFD